MWPDHLFSQRNKTAERAVGLGAGGDREGGGGGGGTNLEEGGQAMKGGLHKVGRLGDLGPLFQLCFK